MKNDEFEEIKETKDDEQEQPVQIVQVFEEPDEFEEIDDEDDDESEDEVPSSDYSDYIDYYNKYNNSEQQEYLRKQINENLRNIKDNAIEKLKQRKNNTLDEQLQAKNRATNEAAKNAAPKKNPLSDLPANGNPAMNNPINNSMKDGIGKLGGEAGEGLGKAAGEGLGKAAGETAGGLAKEGAKEGAKAAGGALKAGAQAAGEAIVSGLEALVTNPYFWVVVGIIAGVLLLVVIIWGAYDYTKKKQTENAISGKTKTVCNYNVNGEQYTNLKVRLLDCDTFQPIQGEELVDFDKYILGVGYAENDGAPADGFKAELLAAKSYALRRPDAMGNANNLKFVEENGQKILQLRNCTSDQVYCDPDKGCSTTGGDTGHTVYSGTSAGVVYKPALAQNNYMRTAANEIANQVIVDSTGNVMYTTYTATQQNKWNAEAESGKTYKEILEDHYTGSKVINITCTTTEDNTTGGSCQTSTPLKLASGETSFTISSPYGYRTAPTAGASSFHRGIDIPATQGTPIYAVFEGQVYTSTDDYGTGGKAVVLSHDLDGDGTADYLTEYMHMSKRDVETGETVTGGQKIGEVGSTGASTGPHLHFGLMKAPYSGDNRFDPEPTLNGLISKNSMFDTAKICQKKSNSGKTFNGTFPYYNQGDSSWNSYKICDAGDYSSGTCVSDSTIQNAGCGYCSFAMIASGFNNDSSINPKTVVDYVAKYNNNPSGGAVLNSTFINQNVLDYYNLKAEVLFSDVSSPISDKKTKLVNALKSGKAIVVLIPGHFISLVGIDSNEKIKLHDPGDRDNVGDYTIDEIFNLYKVQRASKCGGSCTDSEVFEYAVAYSRK